MCLFALVAAFSLGVLISQAGVAFCIIVVSLILDLDRFRTEIPSQE